MNFTFVASVKLAPVITTLVPTGPVVGVKLVIVGGKPITNVVTEVAVPVGAITVMGPVVVPAATVAVSCVAEITLKLVAAVPLNLTAVVPVKFDPSTVTTVPVGPPVGVKALIVGPTAGGVMVKLAFEMSKK